MNEMSNTRAPEVLHGALDAAWAAMWSIAEAFRRFTASCAEVCESLRRTKLRELKRAAKRADPVWRRNYARALARSRRNNLYLKSIGACR